MQTTEQSKSVWILASKITPAPWSTWWGKAGESREGIQRLCSIQGQHRQEAVRLLHFPGQEGCRLSCPKDYSSSCAHWTSQHSRGWSSQGWRQRTHAPGKELPALGYIWMPGHRTRLKPRHPHFDREPSPGSKTIAKSKKTIFWKTCKPSLQIPSPASPVL